MTALFAAIICVLTMFITIPLPSMGYLNFSDFLVLLLSSFMPPQYLILAGGTGTFLADIFLGYGYYAPITFLAKSLEGLIAYYIQKKGGRPYLAYALGALSMLIVYALAEALMGSNAVLFIEAVIVNLPQALGCYVLALIFKRPFLKMMEKIYGHTR